MQNFSKVETAYPENKSSKLGCASRPFYLRTFRGESRFVAVKEVLATDSAPIAHPTEDASLVVQRDRRVEFGHIALVHDKDSIVPNDL